MKKNSILTEDWEHCFVCQSSRNLQEHHVIFGTANRKNSEKYGLTIPLCIDCHTGTKGVHNNRQLDLYLKRIAQLEFEREHSYEEFMTVFGRNYR